MGVNMPLRDYLAGSSAPQVRVSELESRASGLAVGRMEVWPPESLHGSDVVRLIEESGLDVVIVRAGAEDVELAAHLDSPSLVSWHADTLLYLEGATADLPDEPPGHLVMLSPDDGATTDALVERIFAGYRNHYAATPVLRGIDVVKAYQEWTRTALARPGGSVYQSLATDGSAVSLCVVDTGDERYDEVLLGGVVPERRRRGGGREMMLQAGLRARAAGKQAVVSSTQASNVGMMRVWCRLGFVPTMAINTFHVVRRDVQRP